MLLRNKLIVLLLSLSLAARGETVIGFKEPPYRGHSKSESNCSNDLDKCNLTVEGDKDIMAHQNHQLYGMRVDRDKEYDRANKAANATYVLLGMYLATVLFVIIACEKCRK